ncbi:MAG: flagellar filament capping protein FliD [Austwickia sp.]|nr:flagellar filament capping protein FliD [Tetrasphaera sp.]MCO5307762.1 flagellar filament capping protein FliD [Austwickia sp.]
MQISGLTTGFDAASVVDQLMAMERKAGTKIKTWQTQAGAVSQALTKLNGLVKSMTDAASAVSSSITSENIFNGAKGSSSRSDLATVATRNGAASGSLTFSVESLATSGALIGAKTFATAATSIGGTAGTSYSMAIRDGAGIQLTEISVDGAATLQQFADAINEKKSGVVATIVPVGAGDFRLQLTSDKTGAVSNLTVAAGSSGEDGSALIGVMNALSTGTDASLRVGTTASGYTLTSATNVFQGILPGVDVTAVKDAVGTQVTINVSQDVDAAAKKIQEMVTAANDALTNVRINSKADLVNKGANKVDGVFVGDATTRTLTQRIGDVFVGGGGTVPSVAGININRDGTVSFDKSKFAEAYAKDPLKVEETVRSTATRLADVGKSMTDPVDGMLSVAIKSQDALVKDYTSQITRFNERMDQKQALLMRQYNALDSILSKMKSQSDWLAGQLKSLPTINNGQ